MDEAYKKLVDIAYNLHVSGKLEEAKFTYEKLLTTNPDDIEVKNLYAQLNIALKDYDLALNLFNEIYELTKLPDILLNIAKVLFMKQDYTGVIKLYNTNSSLETPLLRIVALAYTKLLKYDEAINVYQKIILNNDANAGDYYNISISYSKVQNEENALLYALKSYELNDKDLNINLHLTSIYENKNDYENALKYLLNAGKIAPCVDIFYRIGVVYKKLNDDENALAYFNAILQKEPDNKNALLNIAFIFNNHDKNVSVEIYHKLLEKYPDDYDLLMQLCLIYTKMNYHEDVINVCDKIIKLRPDEYMAYMFKADSLFALYKYNEALDYYLITQKLGRDDTYIKLQIAYIYSNTDRVEKAKEILLNNLDSRNARTDYAFVCCREKNIEPVRAYLHEHLNLEKKEEDVKEKINSAIYRLKLDKKYGLTEDMVESFRKPDNILYPRLKKYQSRDMLGKDINGKKVLLYSGDGVGDLFMFSRYIEEVINSASKVYIQVPKKCFSLIKYNFPNATVITDNDNLDDNDYDFTSSIFSLICSLDVSLKNIIKSNGYLNVSPEKVSEKSNIDVLDNKKKKIGLFWQGNPTLLVNRSVKLEKLIPLFDVKNTQFYSFQISTLDYESEELKHKLPLIDLAPYIKSYEDTAGLLKNMDLLITIDTSIANLSGALGCKTYLLLPYYTEWRWFYDTETTPWYDSVKIFKQKELNNWDEVVQRVKHELEL